jgi:peptidoglycan hydrolase-like protein with peptidoglycan-binding domain
MFEIEGSVGQGGDNRESDVRVVQQLLNRQDLTPLSTLREDGRSGPATVEAIRHFQARSLGIASPDGRVDPGGRTLRRLNSGPTSRGTGSNPETRQADRSLRAERVDPRVKETAITTRIIDALTPRFGSIRAKIIGGFLSDSDQFWKVNYHWEYLLSMVEHSLTLPIEDVDAKELTRIRSSLIACKPSPDTGYTSSPVGKPEDRSSYDDAIQRYTVVRTMKESFVKVTNRADLKRRSTRSATMFDLAGAPVASPGTSKHGTGYALDIEGDNTAIKSLCKGLGATLVFDEKSHVHVEFKNGLGG